MTPIRLKDFLDANAASARKASVNLTSLNMAHAAPIEDGKQLLSLRYDATKRALVPAG